MFEMVDVAEALGVTAVVTFCLNETAEVRLRIVLHYH